MGTISYPHTGMGIVAGIIFFRGYRYGIELPGGYIPVAIPRMVMGTRYPNTRRVLLDIKAGME